MSSCSPAYNSRKSELLLVIQAPLPLFNVLDIIYVPSRTLSISKEISGIAMASGDSLKLFKASQLK